MASTSFVPATDVRRAADRFTTHGDQIITRHSFSFGAHYDPANTHFGLLLAHNEEIVAAGGGYDSHPHRDIEIVTWVVEGVLAHQDAAGHAQLLYPGSAQRVSAGTGIVHSERNAATEPDGPAVRFVQMWVLPDSYGGEPGYEQADFSTALDAGDVVVVASGLSKHATGRALGLGQRDAALYAARLRPGRLTLLPDAPFVHVFVVTGSVRLEGAGDLRTGDAARIVTSGGRRIVAGPAGAEVLIWEMHAELGSGAGP